MKYTVQVYKREAKLFKTAAPKPEEWMVLIKVLESYGTQDEANARAKELIGGEMVLVDNGNTGV